MKEFQRFYILLILFFAPVVLIAQSDTSRLRIAFAGDIMGHQPQINAAYDSSTGTYNYDACFRYLKPYMSSIDIMIGNLEVTLAGPVYKGYPQFSSPDALARAAKDAGFNVLATANNHCYDRGKKGMERTLAILDSMGIIHSGTFYNSAHRDTSYPLIIEKNGFKLAFLNYTYGTNGISVDSPNIVNLINNDIIKKDIEKARQKNPDILFAYLHWGEEYQRVQNKEQEKLALLLREWGVDYVIGSHPHVVQKIKHQIATNGDTCNSVPIVYSLGNFVSNQRDRYKNGGIIVEYNFSIDSTRKVKLEHFNYLPCYVHKGYIDKQYQFYIIPPMLYLKNKEQFNFSLADDELLQEFYDDTRSHLKETDENRYYEMYKLD